MQKVPWLVSLAHMNKIHQRAKLGQMVLAIKEVKTVKRKNSGQTSSIGLFATELRSCLLSPIKNVFFARLLLITLILTISHQGMVFRLFAANHANCSYILLKSTFLLSVKYSVFSFVASETCFRLFATKLGCFKVYRS